MAWPLYPLRLGSKSQSFWVVTRARLRYLKVQPRAGAKGLMRLHVNGEPRDIDAPLTLAALVEKLGLDARKIAIERNLEIVPRSTYGATVLGEGDRLEIVNFVGGG